MRHLDSTLSLAATLSTSLLFSIVSPTLPVIACRIFEGDGIAAMHPSSSTDWTTCHTLPAGASSSSSSVPRIRSHSPTCGRTPAARFASALPFPPLFAPVSLPLSLPPPLFQERVPFSGISGVVESLSPTLHTHQHPLFGYEPTEVDQPEDVAAGTVPGVKRAAVRKLLHELGITADQLPRQFPSLSHKP